MQSCYRAFINLITVQQVMSKKHLYILLLAMFGITACKKSGAPHIDPVKPPGVDVYVAGNVEGDDINSVQLATYWKNGVPVVLPNSLSNLGSTAFGIAIHDTDVYVVGRTLMGDHFVATYWKNGQAVKLADSESSANAIAINGDDVYIAGLVTPTTLHRKATYWKNGVATIIPPTTETAATEAKAIAVSGNDVYMAGNTYDLGLDQATYWKNGVATVLQNTPSISSLANGIAVNGTDVYVVGLVTTQYSTAKVATVWKNGTATSLTDGTGLSVANSIAINGADVYIAGYINGEVALWKNGKATVLNNGASNQQTISLLNAVALHGNDVFVSGGYLFSTGYGNSVYWRNGLPVNLPNGLTGTTTITVVSK